MKSGRFKAGFCMFWKQRQIQSFVMVGMIFLIAFNYIPLFGIVMGFKDYSINDGIMGIFTSKFNDFKFFREFFSDRQFGTLLKNTLCISLLKLIFTMPAPIIFAIVISETRVEPVRRIVQTVSYLPNFISWVVVYAIAKSFFSEGTGVINQLLSNAGIISAPLDWLTDSADFYGMTTALAIWKSFGWWSIIFLAAISGIDPTLYEAASIDGAGRFGRIVHVTIPGIKASIVTVLILSIGALLGGGMGGSNFDQCYIFGNSMNAANSEIIQTYAFKMGLAKGRYAYATAVELIQSGISIVLIIISNMLSKKLFGESIY